MDGRVLVAMSGGVDSSVAAARLVAGGHDVVGVTLHLWDYPDDGSVKGRCCAPEDVHDARRVADHLGIPHYTFDRRELFEREVVQPFVDAYLRGTTPSPCTRCNRGVKLRELVALADRLEARWLATGHYARLARDSGGTRLRRALDATKDQSYFLYAVPESTLARVVFPLGDSTKAEVRGEALDLHLPGATKGESQELCFVPTGRYDEFVAARSGGSGGVKGGSGAHAGDGSERVRGRIVDETGKEVGTHDGLFRFTVGQRKNLGVALGRPVYVSRLDPGSQTVHVGPRSDLDCARAVLREVTLSPSVTLPRVCDVVVRYRAEGIPALVAPREGGGAEIRFERAARAVVPGQVAVFYDGDVVLGGGTIESTSAPESRAPAAPPLFEEGLA